MVEACLSVMFGCNTVFFLEGRRKVARFSITYNRSDLPHIPVSVQQQLSRLYQALLNDILMDRHTVKRGKSTRQLGKAQMHLLRQLFTRGGEGKLAVDDPLRLHDGVYAFFSSHLPKAEEPVYEKETEAEPKVSTETEKSVENPAAEEEKETEAAAAEKYDDMPEDNAELPVI